MAQIPIIKVCFTGDSQVGKTALIKRFTEGVFYEVLPRTVGYDFKTKPFQIDKTMVRLSIWDFGGGEVWEFLREKFYPRSNVIVIVFDVTNRKTLIYIGMHITKELQEVFKNKTLPPIVLVGNKTDLRQSSNKDHIFTEEGEKFAIELEECLRPLFTPIEKIKKNVIYIETSAKTGSGVGTLFKWIALLGLHHLLSMKQ